MAEETVGILNAAVTGVLSIVAFLFKAGQAERDRRIVLLETKISSLEMTSAAQSSKIDAIFDLLQRIDRSVDRISNALDAHIHDELKRNDR